MRSSRILMVVLAAVFVTLFPGNSFAQRLPFPGWPPPTGRPVAPTPPSIDAQPASIVVLDAAGRLVGKMEGQTSMTVAMTINGHNVIFNVFRETRIDGNNLFVASDDCSGAPLIVKEPDRLLRLSAVTGPELSLWVPDDNGVPTTRNVGSSLRGPDCVKLLPAPFTPNVPPHEDFLVPAVFVMKLTDIFTFPLRAVFTTP